jgi:hypothetical protein
MIDAGIGDYSKLVLRYAVSLSLLQILAGALLFLVEVILSGNLNPSSPGYVGNTLVPESSAHLLIRFAISLAIVLAVYVHLARRHRASFAKAGIGVAVLVSLGGVIFGYFDPYESAYHPYRPVFVFVMNLVANLVLFYVAGRFCKVPIWVRRTE